MTEEEKELFKELYGKFKGLYNRQKINDDIIDRWLRGATIEQINQAYPRMEQVDGRITEQELRDLEDRINRL